VSRVLVVLVLLLLPRPSIAAAPQVQARSTVDRTAIWVADRLTYTIDIVCDRGIDILLDDLAKEKLRVNGLEVLSSDSSATTDAGEKTTHHLRYVMTTYRVDSPAVSIEPISVRYYTRRPGQRLQDMAPAGEVTVPGAVVAFRSTLPDSQPMYALHALPGEAVDDEFMVRGHAEAFAPECEGVADTLQISASSPSSSPMRAGTGTRTPRVALSSCWGSPGTRSSLRRVSCDAPSLYAADRALHWLHRRAHQPGRIAAVRGRLLVAAITSSRPCRTAAVRRNRLVGQGLLFASLPSRRSHPESVDRPRRGTRRIPDVCGARATMPVRFRTAEHPEISRAASIRACPRISACPMQSPTCAPPAWRAAPNPFSPVVASGASAARTAGWCPAIACVSCALR